MTIILSAAGTGVANSGITLSHGNGGIIVAVDSASPYGSTVAVRFNADGTVETGSSIDNAAVTWTSRGNWITGGTADSTYSVRTSAGSTIFTTKPVADGSWIDLSADRSWIYYSTAQEEIDLTYVFEVRKTAGAPPTTGAGTYRFFVENAM